MAIEPNSTLAILMTDMVGSTRQWEVDRSGMWEATRMHDAIADRVVGSHGGRILKARGEGDSLLILFPTAHQAVLAAVALNLDFAAADWPDGIDIRIRSAIHAGDVVFGDHDIYGPTPNRCARIRSLAVAEQILISESVYTLARGGTGPDIGYRDRGVHQLKDLNRPEHLFQVTHHGLPEVAADLLSLDATPNNLPIQVSRFIGRAGDIDRVSEAVLTNRLVSLTGLSGIGKSRLALQVAAELIDQFPGGAWYFDLRDSTGATLLPEIAAKLGLEATHSDDVSIFARLGPDRMLLILDQCDRLRGLPVAIDRLLRNLPQAHLLVCSQDRQGLDGEFRYRVPLLTTVGGGELPDAVVLFLDRARLLRPDLAADAPNLELVDRIVQRLEGLPLAIELAAARVGVLSLDQVAAKLEASFRLISGPEKGLAVAFRESIGSLERGEAELLRRLAVFEGTTFHAFELFCQDDGIDEFDLLDGLQVLIDRSLIDFHDWLSEPRYTMLGSIRDHVLQTSSEVDWAALEDRHASLFGRLVGEAAESLLAGDAETYMVIVGGEYGNIRSALRHLTARGDTVTAQGMAVKLFRYWEARGLVVEGRELLESSLALGTTDVTDAIHNAIGSLAVRQGDFEAGRRHHLEALEMRRRLGKSTEVVGSLNNLANLENDQGNLDAAESLYLEALELNRIGGNRRWEAINLVNLGTLAHRRARFLDAVMYHNESLRAFEEVGMNDYRRFPLVGLGNSLLRLERFSEAEQAFSEALRLAEIGDDQAAMTVSLEGLGTHAVEIGDCERGVRLLAVAGRLRGEIHLPLNPQDDVEMAETLARARATMGDDAFERAWSQGASLPLAGLV
ncbi:MAG TPA: tetratricopeptide repeat protein [Fimbriimonadaceae bacterium]|nr:tetratricopeptide repeat protein [Fimbriimonadaceae bacterium]